jgi:hypothetical protein
MADQSQSIIRNATPLFPIGCPRSGTTLLAKVLNSHQRVLMTNETAVFLQMHDVIEKSRIGSPAGFIFGKEYNTLWADHLYQRVTELVETYYERIRELEGKGAIEYWGEKHPHHYECFDFLTALYPNARYIYIVRDPRDVACSLGKLINVDNCEGLRNWQYAAERCEALSENKDDRSLLHVRYEDFVADYTGTAERIFRWLSLDDRCEEVRSFLDANRNFDAHTLWMQEPVYADFAVQSVGRWRREFSESDLEFAETIAGDFMRRHGYPPT